MLGLCKDLPTFAKMVACTVVFQVQRLGYPTQRLRGYDRAPGKMVITSAKMDVITLALGNLTRMTMLWDFATISVEMAPGKEMGNLTRMTMLWEFATSAKMAISLVSQSLLLELATMMRPFQAMRPKYLAQRLARYSPAPGKEMGNLTRTTML